MRLRTSLFVTLFFPAVWAHAQARPGCPEFPKTLAAMRDCYRPVLVFSPSGKDPRFLRQESILDNAADDMMDRFMVFVPLIEKRNTYTAPFDAKSASLTQRRAERARHRFHIRNDEFQVVLLGEDGEEKLSSHEPIGIEKLDTLIDAMPMRKIEEQRRDSN